MTDRSATHHMLSYELTRLSQLELSDLIAQASPVHSGVGGNSALVTILNVTVFVKRVPLTDLERRPENLLTTANLFELPMFFHYRLGSPGFGAWREVVTHQMTTEWVLTGQCLNFPLLHHWRVLPATRPEPINQAELVRYWGNSEAVGARLEALQNASACVALFLEYIPQNLHQWLSARLAQGGQTAESAVEFVDHNLRLINAFMQAHGLTHFDAHFENILCDDERLYFSDFGLALSVLFDLTATEREFLVHHSTFDRANSALSLVICLLGGAGWEVRLREYLQGGSKRMPATIHRLILRDAPVALALKEFFGQLHDNKGSVYPADSLAKLLVPASTRTVESLKFLASDGQG